VYWSDKRGSVLCATSFPLHQTCAQRHKYLSRSQVLLLLSLTSCYNKTGYWPSLSLSGRNKTELYSLTHILCYFSTINDTLILCFGNTATDTSIVISVLNLFFLMVLTCSDCASETACLVGCLVNDELVLMWMEAVVT
jgi:hypothetical protein